MKLFITNQKKFIDEFPENGNSRYRSHREIHREAFNELSKSISEGNIPLVLLPSYKDDGNVIFDFVNKKDEVYFYEFSTTIS